MNRMNKAIRAAKTADTARRANIVRKDPAVIKAAKESAADISQAARSTAGLIAEAQAAWHRSAGR